MKIYIHLNPKAQQGRGIEDFLRKDLPDLYKKQPEAIFCIDDRVCRQDLEACLWERSLAAAKAGVTHFISAGGDGSHNKVFNILEQVSNTLTLKTPLKLGFIPIGSSNDVCKSAGPNGRGVVESRVTFSTAHKRDIGCAEIDGRSYVFLANASLGITTFANKIYNRRSWLVKTLTKFSMKWAIYYVGLLALLTFKCRECLLAIDGRSLTAIRFLNLGIVKKPFFGGDFRYPYAPQSGQLGAFRCDEMSMIKRLRIFSYFSRGEFPEDRFPLQSDILRFAELRSNAKLDIEIDGEIYSGQDIRFYSRESEVFIC